MKHKIEVFFFSTKLCPPMNKWLWMPNPKSSSYLELNLFCFRHFKLTGLDLCGHKLTGYEKGDHSSCCFFEHTCSLNYECVRSDLWCACVCARVHACMRACVCECMRACSNREKQKRMRGRCIGQQTNFFVCSGDGGRLFLNGEITSHLIFQLKIFFSNLVKQITYSKKKFHAVNPHIFTQRGRL